MRTGQYATVLPEGGANSLSRTLSLLGDEWTMLILQRALLGATRYGQFLAELPISNAVLTGRLGTLVAEGLLTRRIYQDCPTRHEYLLTERGASVWPVYVAIWDWERTWVAHHATELPTMEHARCGLPFRPVLVCATCDAEVGPQSITVEWGPSGGWARSAPVGVTRRRSAHVASPALFPETMAVFGNRWSSSMIGAAFRGVRRFTEFQEVLGAPPGVVAERLRAFVGQGVLTTVRDGIRPDWAEYRLTDKGRAFFPVIVLLMSWGERWYHAAEGPALVLEHRDCDPRFQPVLACDQCHLRLRGHEVRARLRRTDGTFDGGSGQAR